MNKPKANGIECHECEGFANYHVQDGDECPIEPDHATSPVFITDQPLGLDSDGDAYVGTTGPYVYDGDDIDTSARR